MFYMRMQFNYFEQFIKIKQRISSKIILLTRTMKQPSATTRTFTTELWKTHFCFPIPGKAREVAKPNGWINPSYCNLSCRINPRTCNYLRAKIAKITWVVILSNDIIGQVPQSGRRITQQPPDSSSLRSTWYPTTPSLILPSCRSPCQSTTLRLARLTSLMMVTTLLSTPSIAEVGLYR